MFYIYFQVCYVTYVTTKRHGNWHPIWSPTLSWHTHPLTKMIRPLKIYTKARVLRRKVQDDHGANSHVCHVNLHRLEVRGHCDQIHGRISVIVDITNSRRTWRCSTCDFPFGTWKCRTRYSHFWTWRWRKRYSHFGTWRWCYPVN